MEQRISINYDSVNGHGDETSQIAKSLEAKVLLHEDGRSTIAGLVHSRAVYQASQELIASLGENLEEEVKQIRSIGIAFAQADQMRADLWNHTMDDAVTFSAGE